MKNAKTLFWEKRHLIAACSGLLAILSFLAPVVTVKFEDKTTQNIYLWDYFSKHNAYNWAMYVCLAIILIASIFVFLSKFKKEFSSVAALLYVVSIPFVILQKEFYSYNEIENLKSVSVNVGIALSLVFVVLAFAICVSISYQDFKMSVRDIAEIGVLIALSFVLNLLTLFKMPTGGSINLQMLPLFIIALRHGPSHGLIAGGIIYGLLTCLTDGYGFATYPFDYLIGFGSIMILGLFRKLIFNDDSKPYNLKGELFILLGCVLSTLVRFIGGTASSMIIYGYELLPAMQYNSLYVFVSGLIPTVIIMAIYGPLQLVNRRFKVGTPFSKTKK